MRSSPRFGGTVTGEVVIRRPVPEVYRFYRDFTHLVGVIGDVVAVEQTSDTTYRWLVAGPFGTRVPLTVTITEQRADHVIHYQSGGALRGRWKLSFTPDPGTGGTRVREQLVLPLGAIGRAALALIGKFPDREVAANLAALKVLLEEGHGGAAPPGRPASRSDRDRRTP